MIRNEDGIITLFAVILILLLLALIGTISFNRSMVEIEDAANLVEKDVGFYAAEVGTVEAIDWLKTLNLIDDADSAWFYPGSDSNSPIPRYFLTTYSEYSYKIRHHTDGDGNILYFGDVNGDYLWEINTITGVPLEMVRAEGSHIQGVPSIIETIWIFEPPFEMPTAALWVHSNVNGNGVSGAILGEGPTDDSLLGEDYYDSDYNCPAVPDIMYQADPPSLDYYGNTGTDELFQKSAGLYPLVLMLGRLHEMADTRLTSSDISGNKLPDNIPLTNTIIYITGDTKLSQNITGSGILVVDGQFEMSGNLKWEGLILVNGDTTFNGGGNNNSTMVMGAVVAIGNAIALNGSVDIVYDCEALQELYIRYAAYRMTSWKQIFPMYTVVGNKIIRR